MMRTFLATCAALALAPRALAHDGHGLPPDHMHGGDWLALLAATAVVALWMWRRKR